MKRLVTLFFIGGLFAACSGGPPPPMSPQRATAALSDAQRLTPDYTKRLLDAGANPNARVGLKSNVLIRALRNNPTQKEVVGLLVEYGADPNIAYSQQNAMHYAVIRGDIEIAQLLIANGANVKTTADTRYWPLLPFAASRGKTEFVKLFLNHGADPDCCTKWGWTMGSALYQALAKEHLETAEALIDGGAGVRTNERGMTELTLALAKGYDNISSTLIVREEGAMANVLLHKAVSKSSPQVVQSLIDGRASVDREDENGEQPLHVVAERGTAAVAAVLLANGADVNARSAISRSILMGSGVSTQYVINGGATPLHKAAAAGNLDLVNFLLAQGADRNARLPAGTVEIVSAMEVANTSGFTPLQLARLHKHEAVVTVLSR